MNKLSRAIRSQIIHLLVEGNSMRSASRISEVSINTVTKLLIDAGRVCSEYQEEALRNLPCKRLQLDEIWAFSYCKQRNVPLAKNAPEDAGDLWTWVAIDAETKLVPSPCFAVVAVRSGSPNSSALLRKIEFKSTT